MPVRTLIVTAFFSPLNAIASVRVGKLAKYLARAGNPVTVATFDPEPALALVGPSARSAFLDPAAEGIRMVHFPKRPTAAWSRLVATTVLSDRHGRRLHGPLAIVSRAASLARLYLIYRGCRPALRRLLREDPPDAVVTSYGPHLSLWLGLYAKRLRPDVRWVADLRDPVVNERKPGWTQGFDRWLERRYVARADRVVVVSPPMREQLLDSYGTRLGRTALEARIAVLTNGFDPDEAAARAGALGAADGAGSAAPRLSVDGRLHLVYTGLLYAGLSDAAPLFRALGALAARGAMPADGFRLHYAGKNFAQLAAQAAEAGMRDRLVDHGFLPRHEALALQRSADLLLLLSWNRPHDRGVLNAKVYEYLLSRRPILAVVAGEVPGSSMAALVREARSGFAYEEATHGADGPALEAFLADAYDRVRAGGVVSVDPDEAVVVRYSWVAIARDYAALLAGGPSA